MLNPGEFPLMLTVEEAAEYVHARSVEQFRREVREGVWPKPHAKNSRPQRWRRAEIDRVLCPETKVPNDTDEELREMIDRELGL